MAAAQRDQSSDLSVRHRPTPWYQERRRYLLEIDGQAETIAALKGQVAEAAEREIALKDEIKGLRAEIAALHCSRESWRPIAIVQPYCNVGPKPANNGVIPPGLFAGLDEPLPQTPIDWSVVRAMPN